jgi:transposase-like protein
VAVSGKEILKECPHCHSTNFVKNGRTYYGKQNHKCKNCKRQFVKRSEKRMPALEDTVRKLLLERISLRGICRVVDVSRGWLMYYLMRLYVYFTQTDPPISV